MCLCARRRLSQIDAAKYADLVLLVVDGSFGFEMETFEMLNMLQVRVVSILPQRCLFSFLNDWRSLEMGGVRSRQPITK